MGLVLRHPAPAAVVAVALALLAGAFVFARPQYRDPTLGTVIDLSGYPAADHGWTWKDATPGFDFGRDEEEWNLAQLTPSELEPARVAAVRAGVEPSSVRPLHAIRMSPKHLDVLVAGRGSAGGTCVGALLSTRARFLCGELEDRAAVLFVAGAPERNTFVAGIVRGDVTGVRVDQRGAWQAAALYDRAQNGQGWGTFEVTLAPSGVSDRAVLTLYAGERIVARGPIAVGRPGDRLLTPRSRVR